MKYLLLSMRPHQWAKGVFIFFPLIFGQKLLDPQAFLNTLAAFFYFAFAASAMYLINDISDVAEDRNHPEKQHRPLAAGKITVKQAVILAATLIIISFIWSFLQNALAFYIIVFYIILNFVYTKFLKHCVIIDIFCIGAFFYLRILLGGVAANIVLSNWLIMCTILLALFIGFNKRRYDLEYSKNPKLVFSKYNISFLDRMISIIGSCLILSYSFYVINPETIEHFGTKNLIYSIPFAYYGVFRYMYLIDSKWFGGDPAKIVLGDYKIQLTVFLWLLTCSFVIYVK